MWVNQGSACVGDEHWSHSVVSQTMYTMREGTSPELLRLTHCLSHMSTPDHTRDVIVEAAQLLGLGNEGSDCRTHRSAVPFTDITLLGSVFGQTVASRVVSVRTSTSSDFDLDFVFIACVSHCHHDPSDRSLQDACKSRQSAMMR